MKPKLISVRKTGLLAMAAAGLLIQPLRAQVWQYTYDGTALPPQSGWNTTGGNVSANFVLDGVLTMTGAGYYGMTNLTTWSGDSGQGTTIEFRMRVANQGTLSPSQPMSTALNFDGGTSYYAFGVNGTQVGSYAPSYNFSVVPEFNPSEFNIYRITFKPGQTAQVYLNNSSVASLTLPAVTFSYRDNIFFGAPTGAVAANSVTEWDYIRWTNLGTFSPVPEPSVSALLIGSCALGWLVFKRRRIS